MSLNFDKFHHLGKQIEYYLRPYSYPIAIKLIKNKEEIPKDSRQPSKDLGVKNFLCQNFKMVRSSGWTMVITEEDCICKMARALYGWDPITDAEIDFANQFSIGLYSKDLETSQKFMDRVEYLPKDYIGLVISPLTRTKIIPDIVQIYCNPAQAMRLIQSYLYSKGGIFEFSSGGRTGSCREGLIIPFLTDEPQLVILGTGDRVWGGVEDHELLFSFPKSKCDIILEGLEATHKAGLRYPIPKYMTYKPGFQTSFRTKAKRRAGGTIIKEK